MTIGRRIVLGFGMVLCFALVIAGTGLYVFNLAETSFTAFIDHDEKLLATATDLQLSIAEQGDAYRGFLLYGDEKFLTAGKERERDFDAAMDLLKTLAGDAEDHRQLEEIATARAQWVAAQRGPVELRRQGAAHVEEAIALGNKEVHPLREKLNSLVPPFVARHEKMLGDARKDLSATIFRASLLMMGLPALALISATLMAAWLTRAIAGPLREAITRIATSTAEISSMATQMASGAAETATAVSETSSTVEEVKQTAQLATQKARIVSEGASRAADIARSGKSAVEETTVGMNRIRGQMESIAQSIVRLSEQGQAIGEIIASVNDLAEQSNLLAVNAAIEAARAGEQGKGFGVVAQEVRNLAEQSKQATAQVRTILGDIQKATSAAVMATEQGSKAVELGVRQASEAGQAIRSLSETLSDAAQAATQIAASSQQQLAGMDQVTLAMENIRVASAQNVAGTRQSEEAAKSLQQLAARMKSMIEISHA